MKIRLRASTLIETLIAMVIIMVVFAIAIRVFNNMMNSGVSFKKIQVQNQLHRLSKDVQQQGYLRVTQLHIDSVDYTFTTDTSAVAGLSKLVISATWQGRQLGSIKCLYKTKKEVPIED